MTLLVCSACTTRYAGDLARCPNCASAERTEEGSGGSRLPYLDLSCGTTGCRTFTVVRRVYLRLAASGVVEMPMFCCLACGAAMGALSGWTTPTETEETDMPKITVHGGATNAAAEPEHVEGAPSSPGSSSSTSPVKPQPSEKPSEADPPLPARTTGNRSRKARTGGSTARSTATSGPETATPADT